MDEKIDKALEVALSQIRTNLKPDEALKQTQAVLNLMHAKSLQLQQGKPRRKEVADA